MTKGKHFAQPDDNKNVAPSPASEAGQPDELAPASEQPVAGAEVPADATAGAQESAPAAADAAVSTEPAAEVAQADAAPVDAVPSTQAPEPATEADAALASTRMRHIANIPSLDESVDPFVEKQSAEPEAAGVAAHAAQPADEAPVTQGAVGMVAATPEPEGAKKRSGKTGLLIAGIVLGVLAVIYLAGGLFFSRFFYPRTTLNGRDVSLSSCLQVGDDILKQTEDYAIHVTGDNMDLTVRAADIGVATDAQSLANGVMEKQNPWVWPVELFKTHELTFEPGATFDPDKLASVVTAAVQSVNANITPSQNAYVAFNPTSGLFEIQKEVYGSTLVPEQVTEACGKAITDLTPTLELDKSFLERPAVLSDDPRLAQQMDACNTIIGANIDLKMKDTVIYTLHGVDFATWVYPSAEDFGVTFDDEQFREWVGREFSSKYDTLDSTRTYTRPDGKLVTVSGGTYGWVVDSAELAEQLLARVKAGSKEPMDVPTKQQADVYATDGGRDWRIDWVDVDLTEQYARYYNADAVLMWETDVVTGNTTLGHGTPVGVYYIHDKERNTVLVSADIDPKTGKPEYESPVSYWMPFKTGNWGLHDASWRGSFGGNIYTYNGSHGCVNLPVSKAAELWDLVSIGTVVVVHD